jgi:hypothetical protein
MKLFVLTLLTLVSVSTFGQKILAPFQKPMAKQWIFILQDGSNAFETKYSTILPFSEGYAAVMSGPARTWAFIDPSGNELSTPLKRWEPAGLELGEKGFHGGLARIMSLRKFGCINTKGEVVHEPTYDFMSAFVDGIATAKLGREFFILKANGSSQKLSTPMVAIKRFSDGLAQFKSPDGLFGLINTKGEVIVEPTYRSMGFFFDGVAWIKDTDGLVGYIDKTGTVIIKPQYELAGNFDPISHCTRVRKNRSWLYVSRSGQEIQADNATSFGDFSEGFAYLRVENGFGFIDKEGKWLVEPTYSQVKPFNEGMAAVQIGRVWGFINTKGEEVIPPTFVAIRPFKNGYAAVSTQRDKWGIIDKDGKWLFEPRFGTFKDVSVLP